MVTTYSGHIVSKPSMGHARTNTSPCIILPIGVDSARTSANTHGIERIAPIVHITSLHTFLADLATKIAIRAGVGAHMGKRISIQALGRRTSKLALPSPIVAVVASRTYPHTFICGVIAVVPDRTLFYATPS